ncbi:MAG TPA: sugar phosphate isomerase/epimerase [Flavitalea sp.]|nr:sugar phosphate isomerase/epimerase [Flavitalea sp.]
MKKSLLPILFAALFFGSCNEAARNTASGSADSTIAEGVDSWKFGVALWTFHTFNFPKALDKVDSSGLTYIEPNTFHSAGPELKDSMILQLSPEGIDKLKSMISSRGLTVGSLYIVGDSTIQSWKKQFDIAKKFGVKYVTTEPPLDMWDSIDSLAGTYGIKVAIHEHWKGVSHYWNPDTVLMAIKGHPNFGACADLGHWPKSGIDPVEGVKKLSGHILVVHLKDIKAFNDPTLRDVPVGTGVVNFPAVFAELKKQNFNGYIYIERDAEDQPSNLPSVLQTVKYYNDQVSRLK